MDCDRARLAMAASYRAVTDDLGKLTGCPDGSFPVAWMTRYGIDPYFSLCEPGWTGCLESSYAQAAEPPQLGTSGPPVVSVGGPVSVAGSPPVTAGKTSVAARSQMKLGSAAGPGAGFSSAVGSAGNGAT